MATQKRDNPVRYMRRVRRRPRIAAHSGFPGIGPGYSQNDPNCFPESLKYSEQVTLGDYRPIDLVKFFPMTAALNLALKESGAPITPAGVINPTPDEAAASPRFRNRDDWTILPALFGAGRSVQMLAANNRRSALIVQNFSPTANMWVNFGSDAVIGSSIMFPPVTGQGLVLEQRPPNDAIYVIFDAADGIGIVGEGTRS